jgi:hypothetical protein
MLPSLATVLRAAAGAYAETDQFAWQVRAAALLNALSIGYRYWTATPRLDLFAVAIEAVTLCCQSCSRFHHPRTRADRAKSSVQQRLLAHASFFN